MTLIEYCRYKLGSKAGPSRISPDSACPLHFPAEFYSRYPNEPGGAEICLCVFRPKAGPTWDWRAEWTSKGHTCMGQKMAEWNEKTKSWKPLPIDCKKCEKEDKARAKKRDKYQSTYTYRPMPAGTKFKE